LAPFAGRTTLVEAVYDELPEVLADLGHPRVQSVLLDLGLSSLQIDEPQRGFAYAVDAPLDMRMDGKQPLTAAEILNTYPVRELARVLRTYGEERFADRIARRVVAEREQEPFTTSARLVAVLREAIPMATQKTGGHPAKRTFQALRIEVNGELDALESVLPSAVAALTVGGRIAVLAYHSLEDRLVKRLFAVGSHDTAPRNLPVVPAGYGAELRLLTRGAQRPTAAEAEANPRAASARLRAAVRIEEKAA
jgi:16S rRNA (cytosine1402-N4)-methyltransferase